MEKVYKTIDFWSEKYNGLFQLEPEPFHGAPVTPRSTFLFSYSASPMVPCSIDYSGWYHLPDPFYLASYLRFMMLPVYFAWALDLDEHLNVGNGISTIEELLEKQDPEEREQCQAVIRNMRKVIGLLDDALAADNDKSALRILTDVETMFNRQLGGIGGWSFEIQLYNSPLGLGEKLMDLYDPEEWETDGNGYPESDEDFEWQFEDEASYEERQYAGMKLICQTAATDPEKGRVLLKLIRRTHMGMD